MSMQDTVADMLTRVRNSQINPSCLLSYLGIRGIGVNMTENPVAERIVTGKQIGRAHV